MSIDWPHLRATRTVFEDDDAIVLDKPAGLTLVGARDGDDLMVAARAVGEWVSPAHRIDRVTSGLVLLARSDAAHARLTAQFRAGEVDKRYLALVHGSGLPERATIDLPLAEGRKGQVRVGAPRDAIEWDQWGRRWSVPAAAQSPDARPATTTITTLAAAADHTALVARPVTGRRHQIRVHLAWIGHAIVGDPRFEAEPVGRARLHSWRLGFESRAGGVELRVDPEPGFFDPIVAVALPD